MPGTDTRFLSPPQCSQSVRLLLALLLGAVLLAGGCPGGRSGNPAGQAGRQPAGRDKPGRSTAVPQSGTLAYAGNFIGFQRPCGCSTKQDGGLVRLGTAMSWLRAGNDPAAKSALTPLPAGAVLEFPANLPEGSPVWLLECGNFADPKSRTPGQRAKVHLSALALLGCSGAVLSGEELALDSDSAKQALADAPVPLLSCNLQCILTEVTVVPSVELSPGWYALGVSVPKPGIDPPCAWGDLADAVSSARTAIAALPEGARVIIAGAGIPPGLAGQLRSLEAKGRSIVAVIGHGETAGADSAADGRGLPALLTPPEPKGKKLRLASFYSSAPSGVLSWDLTLDDKWPDDSAVLSLLREGEEALRQAARSDPGNWRNVDWGSQGGMSQEEAARLGQKPAPPLEQTYAGSESCKACHSAAYKVWETSGHRHSYQPLLERNEAQTLDCLECHTTGLLRPGGYDLDKSYDVLHDPLAAVGCENCHGPAAMHVKLAGEGKLKSWKSPDCKILVNLGLQPTSLSDCTHCHDDYNSPDFEAQSYWEKVKH